MGWPRHSHGFHPPNLYFPKQTYIDEDEYAIFLDEFQKNPNTTWIVKPNNKSQGQGIFLLKKINQLKKIVPGANLNVAFKGINMNETYVISRYIDNPMLIGGKKFDLRMYSKFYAIQFWSPATDPSKPISTMKVLVAFAMKCTHLISPRWTICLYILPMWLFRNTVRSTVETMEGSGQLKA